MNEQKLVSLVIVCRPTPEESEWIRQFYRSGMPEAFDTIIVENEQMVHHIGLEVDRFSENLDGQICRKKNLGVAKALEDYTLVCHADAFPHESFLDALRGIDVGENEVLCPRGIGPNGAHTLTWARQDPANRFMQPFDMPFIPGETYISGAAIFARTALFRKYPWDENLRWGHDPEDCLYSRMLEAAGVTQRAEERLICEMTRGQ